MILLRGMLEEIFKVICINYLIQILIMDAIKVIDIFIYTCIFVVIFVMSISRVPNFSFAPGPQNLRTGPGWMAQMASLRNQGTPTFARDDYP